MLFLVHMVQLFTLLISCLPTLLHLFFCGLLVYMPFRFPLKKAEQINFPPLTSLLQSSQASNLAGCLETRTSFANNTTCQICLLKTEWQWESEPFILYLSLPYLNDNTLGIWENRTKHDTRQGPFLFWVWLLLLPWRDTGRASLILPFTK